MYSKELDVSIQLALKAGKKIMEIYKTDFEVDYKSDQSPLTKADLSSNKIIVKGLKEAFSDYAILSEESKDNLDRIQNSMCFIVDPIDGTKEFVKKNGEFTVNIGLVKDGKPMMGVIFAPVLNKLYYASKKEGSYVSEVKDYKLINKTKLNVSNKTTDLVIVGSKSHQTEQFQQLVNNHSEIKSVISAGSSIKGCLVAEGKADIYYRFGHTSEWDTCAMQAIVEETGAIFKQMDYSEMTYNRKNNLNDKGFYVVNRKENIFV